MSIGSVLYHEVYGKLKVSRKAYSSVKNAVIWYAVDSQGIEHELDGTETTKEQKQTNENVFKLAGVEMIKGDKGERGIIGPRGFQGYQGVQGLQGKQGIEGKEGKPGKDGKDGSNGKDGKIGPRGYDGPKGKQGDKGDDGDSAFEIAKKEGFTGTKKEWLESLKGKDGLNGLNGGGGIHKIDDATDVLIQNPTDNQSLTYDAATKKWVNETVSGGGSGTVETIVAGNNIDVDATDPANPIVSVETLTLADISDITASATEVNYTDGVTSAIQTQLDAKLDDSQATAFGLSLLDDADASAGRTTLELVAGGAGDIWVEKAGDTMTGQLVINKATSAFLVRGAHTGGTTFEIHAINETASNADTVIAATGYGTNVKGVFIGRGARGTEASPTASQENDELMFIGGRGYGATGFHALAGSLITFNASENYTDTARGADIRFKTTPLGSTTSADRLIIRNTGLSVFKNTSAAATTSILAAANESTTAGTGSEFILANTTDIVANTNGLVVFRAVRQSDGSNDFTLLISPGGAAAPAIVLSIDGSTKAITAVGDISVPDEAYGAGWNASLEVPTKNAVYDQMELKAPLASPTFTGTVTLPTGLTGVIRTDSGVVSVDSDVTDIVAAASTTDAGKVELAIASETTTGTDATRAVTPDGLAGSDYGKRVVGILVSDPLGDAITTGDGKATFRIPSVMNGYNLVSVAASVSTVSSSGTPTVQIRNATQAVDMLTTKITIDASETDSSTAAAAAVIDTANDDVATGDAIFIDIDVAGTGAKGLYVELQFQLP